MKKKGSIVAEEIMRDMKRAEYFKEYAKRRKEKEDKIKKIK